MRWGMPCITGTRRWPCCAVPAGAPVGAGGNLWQQEHCRLLHCVLSHAQLAHFKCRCPSTFWRQQLMAAPVAPAPLFAHSPAALQPCLWRSAWRRSGARRVQASPAARCVPLQAAELALESPLAAWRQQRAGLSGAGGTPPLHLMCPAPVVTLQSLGGLPRAAGRHCEYGRFAQSFSLLFCPPRWATTCG